MDRDCNMERDEPGFLAKVWTLTRNLEECPGFGEVFLRLRGVVELVFLVVLLEKVLNNGTRL